MSTGVVGAIGSKTPGQEPVARRGRRRRSGRPHARRASRPRRPRRRPCRRSPRPVRDPRHERVVGGLHVRCLSRDAGDEHIAGCLPDRCVGRGALRGAHRGRERLQPAQDRGDRVVHRAVHHPGEHGAARRGAEPRCSGGGGGVGLAEIAPSATSLQCTTALSFGANDAGAPAVDDDAGAPDKAGDHQRRGSSCS